MQYNIIIYIYINIIYYIVYVILLCIYNYYKIILFYEDTLVLKVILYKLRLLTITKNVIRWQ